MDPDNTPDLFEIKLSQEGIRYITKFANVAKFLVLIGALISLLMLVVAAVRLKTDDLNGSSLDFWQEVYFRSFPYINLVHSILFILQLFYYWKLKKLITDGVNNKNEIAFNHSFKALFLNAVWGLITLSSSLVATSFDTFIFFKYYI